MLACSKRLHGEGLSLGYVQVRAPVSVLWLRDCFDGFRALKGHGNGPFREFGGSLVVVLDAVIRTVALFRCLNGVSEQFIETSRGGGGGDRSDDASLRAP